MSLEPIIIASSVKIPAEIKPPVGKFQKIISLISTHAESCNKSNWVSDLPRETKESASDKVQRNKKYGEIGDAPLSETVISRPDVISDLRIKRFFNVLMVGFPHFREKVPSRELSGAKRFAYCVPMVLSFIISAGTLCIPGGILATLSLLTKPSKEEVKKEIDKQLELKKEGHENQIIVSLAKVQSAISSPASNKGNNISPFERADASNNLNIRDDISKVDLKNIIDNLEKLMFNAKEAYPMVEMSTLYDGIQQYVDSLKKHLESR